MLGHMGPLDFLVFCYEYVLDSGSWILVFDSLILVF